MPMQRSPEDDLADARELSYAGAIGFSVWDEKVYSISSQPLSVARNVKAYRYEQCKEFEKAEELYLKNILEENSITHCYERLVIMYRKQKRYADEVAVLEKHFALDGSDKQKLSERLEKAKQLKQGIHVVKTKEKRIETRKKKEAEKKETIRICNENALQSYKKSGVVIGVEIFCCGDESCAACREISGKRFNLNNAPRLPNEKCTNDSCRCTYIPIVDDKYGL